MSKYTVVTYQPLKGPRAKYWVPSDNPISRLLYDVGNPEHRCTREPINNGVLRLKGPEEHLCFLESILEHDLGLEVHFAKEKHSTYDIVPSTEISKRLLQDEIRDFKEQVRKYEQLSNLSLVSPQVDFGDEANESLRKKPRIDPEDEANLELILK